MAFLTIKATSLLLIITLVFSSYGTVEAGFWSALFKSLFTRGSKINEPTFPASGNKVHPPVTNGYPLNKMYSTQPKGYPVPRKNGSPTSAMGSPTLAMSEKSTMYTTMQMKGEEMAKKFFGSNGKKGFRIAWKSTKLYLKATKRCEEYDNILKPYCTPRLNKLQPSCVVEYCILVATESTLGETPTSCSNDCDFPIEAKCEKTLNITKCGRLNV